ncbi:hypothetical protein PRNP1_000062 [Phytophthora ramorum]
MNRLLQHFVDSSGSQASAASRPPIPAPPQSSGGSYNAGNRGSYQRAAPGGPFYYQPPPTHYQQRNGSGLEEIPLTSQSTGGVYETVDLDADSGQQQRRFTPNGLAQSYGYKTATPPGSREAHRAPFYQQKTPGSTGELFANGPPPARELFGGPPSSSGSGGNPYRRQSNPVNNSVAVNANGGAMFGHSESVKDPFTASPANGNGVGLVGHSAPPPNDPFAASPSQNGGFGGQAPQHDLFATPPSEENRNMFGGESVGASAHDPFAVQRPMDSGLQYQQQGYQQQQQHHEQLRPASSETSASPFAAVSSNSAAPADPFASAPSQSTYASVDPFASTPSHSGSSLFDSSAPSNGAHQRMASADSLFSSPAPSNNGAWAQATQPEPSPAQTQNAFTSEAPTASSLFGGSAPSQFEASPPAPSKSQICASPPQVSFSPSPVNPQAGIPPSPTKSPVNVPPSPMKPPVHAPPSPMINASSPLMRPQVTVPASPVMRPEDHLTPAFGSMKLSTPAKSPLKSGLDVRHMKFPAGKREDDAVSNAPSMAPSRMSMLSTLDDSLKLSDMYKQMTARLEGEKHDLLKVVTSQAQEIAQMKKQIQSLELQLKKSRLQNV